MRQPIRKLGPQCLNPSIPSVSFIVCYYIDAEIVPRSGNFIVIQMQLCAIQIQFLIICVLSSKKKKRVRKLTCIWVFLFSKWYLWCLGRADVTAVQVFSLFRWIPNSLSYFCLLVGDGLVKPEALNKKAIQIINRVRDKLTGEHVFVWDKIWSDGSALLLVFVFCVNPWI